MKKHLDQNTAKKAIILAMMACGCASNPSISFQTNPSGADVFVSPIDGSAPKKIGVTPLLLNSSDAFQEIGNIGPLTVEFRKNGFQNTKSMVTDLAAVDLTIKAELQRSTGLEDIEQVNKTIDQLFEAQRLTRAGRLDDALNVLAQVQKDAPELSALYEIQAGIYYLQKKPRLALDAYQSAIKYNPKNAEALRMRNYLMASLGVEATDNSKAPTPAATKTEVKKQ